MASQLPATLRSPAPEKELGYGQIFTAVLRRKHWLILGVLGGLGISGFLSLRQVPAYNSSMQLLVESIYQGKAQLPTRISKLTQRHKLAFYKVQDW